MLTRLPAADALAGVHADLGALPLRALTVADGPRTVRTAVATARRDARGGLVAVLAPSVAEAGLVRAWLREGDAHTLPVAEGALVLVHAPGRPTSPAPPPVRRVLTPDLAPVPRATLDDLDDALVHRVLRRTSTPPDRRLPAHATPTEAWLARYGLLAHDGERWRPTIAAMVALGRRPDVFLPGCVVAGHVDGEPVDARGPLPALLARLDRDLPADLDRAVVLELVLNALVHRAWSDPAPVRLTVCRTRLELVEPGHLAPDAPAHRQPPNPRLLALAADLDLTRGDGRGLGEVTRRLARAGLPRPTLRAHGGEVRVVVDLARRAPAPPTSRHPPPVPAAPAAEPTPPTPATIEPPSAPAAAVPALLPRAPTDRADAVLTALRARGRATTRELAATLGCSRPVVGKVLTALVAAGKVRPTAADGHSPFQAYEAADA
ncbi:hypothetical protein L6R53_04810 [Myxococcota bacterium]|nr:hypothetical protein [Myxococcota bacterium]